MSRMIYVGGYTRPDYRGKAEGIYVYKVDTESGLPIWSQTVAGSDNPSFLAMHPTRPLLYCVNETRDGGVSAFAVEAETGHLTLLNRQPSLGDDPCHLCVDPTGKFVIVANYTSGNITVLPIETDGSLGPSVEMVQHHGSGPNVRQTGPRMHMVSFSPDHQYLIAADLGIDQVLVYRLDSTSGKLTLHEGDGVHPAQLTPGAGPRHFAFHPNGQILYVINELASTIVTCGYDAVTTTLTPKQTVSTLPPGYTDTNSTAELMIAPSGKFVYGSNRGADSIAVFAVDATTSELTAVDFVSTQGKNPRSFAIDPEGAMLYAANQNSDTLVLFQIDHTMGSLTPTEHVVAVPTPVCVLIADI